MLAHSPRAFPWEIEPPVGNHHVKGKRRPKARARRPRERTCLNKKCGRKYHARRWNQRYCQDPECLREVNRWQAARRQAKRRKADTAKAQHAQAEKARRQQAKSAPKDRSETRNLRRRVVTQQKLFSPSLMRSAGLPRTARDLAPQPGTLSAAPPAGRPFAMSWIVNVSGSLAAPWMAGRSGPLSIRPHAERPTATSVQRRRRCAAAGTPGMTTPPGRAGRQLSRGSGRLI